MKGPVSFPQKELTAIDDWVKLTVANSSIEAYLIVGRLEEAGITSRQETDRSGYGDYLLGGSNPQALVRIFVQAPNVEMARQVLEGEGEIEEEPGGGEQEVLADRGRGRAVLWISIIIVIAVVMATLVADLDDIFQL